MDELIARYAAKLQEIYDERVAGAYTFEGILSEFARKVNEKQEMSDRINDLNN